MKRIMRIGTGRRMAATSAMAALSFLSAAAADYSWRKPHATVLPTGDLQWAPEPFVYAAGPSVRYIDFEAGDDSADGESKDTPWKHHPWDAAATGNAKACVGIRTYVFKRGVAYRGFLAARESGRPDEPIRLTSDPSWGEGEAQMLGSLRIAGGWERADAAAAPGFPEPEEVWYTDLGGRLPPKNNRASAMWMLADGAVTRLAIARDPNWRITDPDLPTKGWHVWKTFQGATNKGTIADPEHLAGRPAGFFDGVQCWTQHSHLMGSVHLAELSDYNPENGSFTISSPGGAAYGPLGKPSKGKPAELNGHVRYYLENLPAFLDEAGEYYFDRTGAHPGRLYVRLAPDADPNRAVFEVSVRKHLIEIRDQSDIEISGLSFSFNEAWDKTFGYPWQIGTAAAVRMVGNCRGITVANCAFRHVMSAVVAFPRPVAATEGPAGEWSKDLGPWNGDVMDRITVRDNDIADVDQAGAVWIAGNSEMEKAKGLGYGVLKRADVLRNRIVNTGFRPGRSPTSPIPAIYVILPETAEIAGNIVSDSWGSGIFTMGGKTSGAVNDVPLSRILVHHNKVEHTMLGCNDYGGIEIFQGGPAYFYNNISRNAVGTRTFNGKELGYNLYLDGGFKIASFNNILDGRWRPGSKGTYSHCGYLMVFGFLDHFFHNTVHQVEYGLNGSSGNRSCVLGNLIADCKTGFVVQNRPGDASMEFGGDTGEMGRQGIPTMSYGRNVFYGKPSGGRGGEGAFGMIGGTSVGSGGQRAKATQVHQGRTLEELRSALETMKARDASIGWHADRPPLADAAGRDFSLPEDSPAIGRGVKFFLPWGLSRTVGEWNFYRHDHQPAVVLGEHFYMQPEHLDRAMYYFLPRFDLEVPGADTEDYVEGVLEDWIPGALHFDGKTRYAVLTHEEMFRDAAYPGRDGTPARTDGRARKTPDMGTNSFLIEAVFRTEPGRAGGVLVGKADETGYLLGLDAGGRPQLELMADGKRPLAAAADRTVHDGQWHHLIAEVDRPVGRVRFYIDGKPAGEAAADLEDASLANGADLLVGKSGAGRFFAGDLDFLRIARGTLADALTTIDELYAWQFDGPHLHDFAGRKPSGPRDAGALGRFADGE